MTGNRPKLEEVRDHYAAISPVYKKRANQTCEARYFDLIEKRIGHCNSVLELGAGAGNLIERLKIPRKVAIDASPEMLGNQSSDGLQRMVADAAALPFRDQEFDAVFSVNLLEHVQNPEAVIAEAARVLKVGGIFLSFTPNGGWEKLLDIVEKLSLKLPEGPHRFLTSQELGATISRHLTLIELQTCLIFPAGGLRVSKALDALTGARRWRGGFFQVVIAKK